MLQQTQLSHHAFILKLWPELDPGAVDGQPLWRGSIQHVHGQKIHYFTHLEQLPGLLSRLLAPTDASDTDSAVHGGY